MNYPITLKDRPELELRLGIKSSLPNLRSVVSTTYILYIISDKSSNIDYSEEYKSDNKTKIKLNSNLKQPLLEYFDIISAANNVEGIIDESPLFTAQMEPLLIGLELFFKLGKIEFTIDKAYASERTGGERFNKLLKFGTNIKLLDLALRQYDSNSVKETLFSWLQNKVSTHPVVENTLCNILSIFTEETQFRIRTEHHGSINFQQEGIYESLIKGNRVTSKDAKEQVGPFRILKAFVKEGLHPYLNDDGDFFTLKDSINIEGLKKYSELVSNGLDLIPKRTTLTQAIVEASNDEIEDGISQIESEQGAMGINKIYFGAPGTGKSHAILEELKRNNVDAKHYKRVTFHPDMDYSSFIGGYKPYTDEEDEGKIKYKFVPQIFIDMYVNAWSAPSENYYLVIEEINRGNCAEIFGDIFQLLDRNSEYNIEPSTELREYLKSTERDRKVTLLFDGKLQMPERLSILASMNTSDQSLYPMDSAFKRRWDWEYMAINTECENSDFVIKISDTIEYSWLKFLKAVNLRIYEVTKSEDKQLGNWFVNATKTNNIINKVTFINKVIFYLWNDVFKDEVFHSDNIFVLLDAEKKKIRNISFSDFFNITIQDKLLINLIESVLGVENNYKKKNSGEESSVHEQDE